MNTKLSLLGFVKIKENEWVKTYHPKNAPTYMTLGLLFYMGNGQNIMSLCDTHNTPFGFISIENESDLETLVNLLTGCDQNKQ